MDALIPSYRQLKGSRQFSPTLKDVALAGASGSKAMKQVSHQMFSIVVEAAGESNIKFPSKSFSFQFFVVIYI